jgi:hypothetical protein
MARRAFETLNRKVKVLEGEHKEKILWVPSVSVKKKAIGVEGGKGKLQDDF